MIRPSARSTVAQNWLSFSASPASSMRMGIFLMSINSVVISLRFDASPKTKFAAGSVRRPWRGVPIMTGRKTGRVSSGAGIVRFVAGTGGSLQAQFARSGQQSDLREHPQFAGVAELADAPDLGSGGEIRRGSSPLPGISTNDHRQRHQK